MYKKMYLFWKHSLMLQSMMNFLEHSQNDTRNKQKKVGKGKWRLGFHSLERQGLIHRNPDSWRCLNNVPNLKSRALCKQRCYAQCSSYLSLAQPYAWHNSHNQCINKISKFIILHKQKGILGNNVIKGNIVILHSQLDAKSYNQFRLEVNSFITSNLSPSQQLSNDS